MKIGQRIDIYKPLVHIKGVLKAGCYYEGKPSFINDSLVNLRSIDNASVHLEIGKECVKVATMIVKSLKS